MLNFKNNKFKVAMAFIATLVLSSCVEPDDLTTENAQEGGLVYPASTQIGYLSGGTVNVSVDITESASAVTIDEIEFYKSYYRAADEIWSNEVMHAAVPVSGTSAGFTANYADLKADLLLDGAELPASDASLAIADYWQIKVKSKLSDGRVVENAVKVKIVVSNAWSGTYTVVGNLDHPSAGPVNPYDDDRLLTPTSPTQSQTIIGYFQNPAYSLILGFNPDNSITISGDVAGSPVYNDLTTGASYYDPLTRKIHLFYTYNAAAPRRLQEVLTPKD